jgi:hypothetical protein
VLRVAIGLDRTHAATVDAITLAEDGDDLVLGVVPRPGVQVDLEVFTANERRRLLEDVVGRTVRVEAAGADGATGATAPN